jgi:hypothetical protein
MEHHWPYHPRAGPEAHEGRREQLMIMREELDALREATAHLGSRDRLTSEQLEDLLRINAEIRSILSEMVARVSPSESHES